jgi:hypothetical protein
MRLSHRQLLVLGATAMTVAACAGGSSHETSTTTDTTVTPVKARDTTVVQKTVDVKVDTTKKTNNKP